MVLVFDREQVLAMLARVPEDEPIFVLRAQDAAAVHALEAWIEEASRLEANVEKLEGAEEHRTAFVDWQGRHPNKVKVPD